jgi:transcriptional regulator with XRE-family HTH domain
MPNPKRSTHFLTKAERTLIRQYAINNPHLTHEQVGDHFGVSKSTVHNIKREAQNREYFEKKIIRLTNDLTKAADNIFKLQNEILALKRR